MLVPLLVLGAIVAFCWGDDGAKPKPPAAAKEKKSPEDVKAERLANLEKAKAAKAAKAADAGTKA